MTYAAYGPLLLTTDVDDAFITLLRTWMPTYLSRFEEERGLPNRTYARPRSYASVLDDDEFPDDMLPGVFVTASSTDAAPQLDADGNYYASWLVMVSCVARGQTSRHARQLASIYEGCVRRIMLQQPMSTQPDVLEGEVRWAGTPMIARVTDTSGSNRYLNAGIGRYTAYIDKAVQAGAGPSIPMAPYPDPDPINRPDEPTLPLVPVTAVTTGVRAVPLDQEVTP